MKVKIEKSWKSMCWEGTPATRIKLKEVAPDLFSQENVDATALQETEGRTFLAKGCLYLHFDDKSGEFLRD